MANATSECGLGRCPCFAWNFHKTWKATWSKSSLHSSFEANLGEDKLSPYDLWKWVQLMNTLNESQPAGYNEKELLAKFFKYIYYNFIKTLNEWLYPHFQKWSINETLFFCTAYNLTTRQVDGNAMLESFTSRTFTIFGAPDVILLLQNL